MVKIILNRARIALWVLWGGIPYELCSEGKFLGQGQGREKGVESDGREEFKMCNILVPFTEETELKEITKCLIRT